ncbi:MAG: SURF1 family cytochrome oxidase biogenesis protein [Erythrobacter sp.]|jgi:surfeit locus 1 family protein|nr:SURF1 family cytochrome oxidase biogenesis protein [Erythrobacter sp.]
MSLRLPILPTIIVVAAAATMVALGIWQLGRADEKARQIERYAQAQEASAGADFPISGEGEEVWFRQSTVACASLKGIEPVAGTAASGAKGWAIRARCETEAGGEAIVELGFQRDLAVPDWQPATISGTIAPGPRLVADPPQAGLEPLARPNPSDLPNNHLAYAGQWFFFAVTALVIYALALRARARGTGRRRN